MNSEDIRALEFVHEQVRRFAEARHPSSTIREVIGDTQLIWAPGLGVRHKLVFEATVGELLADGECLTYVKVLLSEDGQLRLLEEHSEIVQSRGGW